MATIYYGFQFFFELLVMYKKLLHTDLLALFPIELGVTKLMGTLLTLEAPSPLEVPSPPPACPHFLKGFLCNPVLRDVK